MFEDAGLENSKGCCGWIRRRCLYKETKEDPSMLTVFKILAPSSVIKGSGERLLRGAHSQRTPVGATSACSALLPRESIDALPP